MIPEILQQTQQIQNLTDFLLEMDFSLKYLLILYKTGTAYEQLKDGLNHPLQEYVLLGKSPIYLSPGCRAIKEAIRWNKKNQNKLNYSQKNKKTNKIYSLKVKKIQKCIH